MTARLATVVVDAGTGSGTGVASGRQVYRVQVLGPRLQFQAIKHQEAPS